MSTDPNRFDENVATQPMSRDVGYGQQSQQPGMGQPYPPGYGYYGGRGFGRGGMGMGMGTRRQLGIETKPFFLTSEFLGTVMAIIAIAASAASLPNFDAPLAWILITSLIALYTLSRGIAKSGIRSRSYDPREQLLQRADGVQQHEHAGQ